jgi:putative exporter of polyketide antibiotics
MRLMIIVALVSGYFGLAHFGNWLIKVIGPYGHGFDNPFEIYILGPVIAFACIGMAIIAVCFIPGVIWGLWAASGALEEVSVRWRSR